MTNEETARATHMAMPESEIVILKEPITIEDVRQAYKNGKIPVIDFRREPERSHYIPHYIWPQNSKKYES